MHFPGRFSDPIHKNRPSKQVRGKCRLPDDEPPRPTFAPPLDVEKQSQQLAVAEIPPARASPGELEEASATEVRGGHSVLAQHLLHLGCGLLDAEKRNLYRAKEGRAYAAAKERAERALTITDLWTVLPQPPTARTAEEMVGATAQRGRRNSTLAAGAQPST